MPRPCQYRRAARGQGTHTNGEEIYGAQRAAQIDGRQGGRVDGGCSIPSRDELRELSSTGPAVGVDARRCTGGATCDAPLVRRAWGGWTMAPATVTRGTRWLPRQPARTPPFFCASPVRFIGKGRSLHVSTSGPSMRAHSSSRRLAPTSPMSVRHDNWLLSSELRKYIRCPRFGTSTSNIRQLKLVIPLTEFDNVSSFKGKRLNCGGACHRAATRPS